MTHIFVDTDIILDIITGRQPFSVEASRLFTLIEEEALAAYASSLSFSNLYYVLRKYASHQKVVARLDEVSDLLKILNVDESIVKTALRSRFKDFEDALQCYSAQGNSLIDVIITRNIKDYKPSELPVMTPGTFIKTFHHSS